MYKYNYEDLLNNILNLCKENQSAIQIKDFKKFNILIDIKCLNEYLKRETNYLDYQDFCRKNGYKYKNDYDINGVYKPTNELVLEDYIYLVKLYNKTYGKFPSQNDFKYNKGLPSSSSFYRTLKKYNMTLSDFDKLVGNNFIRPHDYSYDYWKVILIEKCNELGRALKWEEFSSYNLPNARWFVENCNNEKVTDFNKFVEYELNLIPRYALSKERASEIIIELQKTLDRPLMKKDFKTIENGGIGVAIINRIWGSYNNMKKDLGLEGIRESMLSKQKTLDEIKRDIVRICAFVYEKEKRKIITQADWKLIDGITSYPSCCRYLNKCGMSIREFISLIGFNYIEAGNGLTHTFDDLEHVKSQFEMKFSKFLKENLNLKYDEDYFKEVRYKEFIPNYKGLIDCDYVISYKNRKIFIEIAGMIRDGKKNFINNIPITNSKSKEKYRLKLIEKEKMLKDNNLEYYILFPSDLSEDFLLSIFN